MKQLRIFGLLVSVLLMGSCDKGENEATGTGDVMIMSKRSGTDILYGLSINAYTFSAFTSVTAVALEDPEKLYTLNSNQGYKTSFLYETPASEMTVSQPVASTFRFSATFANGLSQQFEDVLSSEALVPSTIDSLHFFVEKKQLRITWSAVTGADFYVVDIMDGTTNVFGTPELAKTIKAITVNVKLPGADSGFRPVSGKTYTVRVWAYQFESQADLYNLQSLSVVERPIAW